MIRLERLSKIYLTGPEQVRALDNIDLEIERGEFVAIMGPSGSGKSTLMNVIGLLDRPTSGHYFFDEHDVARISDDARTRLRSHEFGYVFQHFNLLPRMSAVEQVELPLVYQGVHNRRRLALKALSQVGLVDRANHRPTQLSGGQQQRVAIARALVANPRVIIADEPTGALDTKTGEEVMAIFEELVRQQAITVIIVTHEASIAAHADRLIRMRDGRIIEDTRKPARQLAATA